MSATWSGRRVLVTGAGGFIGSHLTERLVREGADVRAFVQYEPNGSAGWLDEADAGVRGAIDVRAGDIRDRDGVEEAVEGVDTVFHLAALIGIPYSYRAPDSYVQTNVTGTLNVLQACRRHGARLVQTSTSEVYGTARYAPIDEEHPLQAQSPYAASKVGSDALALSFHRSFGMPVTIARPFNTYGPRQSDRAVIPTIIGQLLAGAESIRLGSLHPTRDFNYVEDTAAGFLALAESERVTGQVVNVGSGREISIGDLARLLMKIVGHDAEIVTQDERTRPKDSEVERLLCDNTKARELAAWEPRVSLEDGLQRTVEWFRTHSRHVVAHRYAV